MGASVCTADETSLQARYLCVHGGSDVLAGLSPSVYTFIGHSAPKGTISVCTRIEDICGLVGVLWHTVPKLRGAAYRHARTP